MLAGHSATLWEGNIYIWGGKSEKGVRDAGMYSPSMYLLSPHECVTTGVARMKRLHVTGSTQGGDSYGPSTVPKGRAYHSAACYGRYLFITGGLSDESFASAADMDHHNSSLPVFDLERRSWSFRTTFGDVPSARCHHVSVMYGDTLMLHGGYPIMANQRKDLSPEEIATMQHALYDVHELHTMTLKWTRIHTTQSPSLWGHSAIVYNADVIVFGGVDVVENAETGSIAVWSTSRQRWVWVDSQSLDLRCTMHTAVQDGGRMLVFGGVSFRTKSKLRTLYEFNLDFGSWRELHPQGQEPAGRLGHAAVVHQQTLFIIGGSVSAEGGDAGTSAGSGGGDSFERCIHLYNIARNTWTRCELAMADEMESDDHHEQSLGQGDGLSAQEQPTWIAAEGTQMALPQDQEWRTTAGSIRDTIARARAIQSLTSGAANALEKSMAGGAVPAVPIPHGMSMPRQDDVTVTGMPPLSQDAAGYPSYASIPQEQSQPHLVGTPSAHYQHQQPQYQRGGLLSNPNAPAMSSSLGPSAPSPGRAANDQETWKMIDYLKAENQHLRRELEEFRSMSLGGGARNPYEVPVYNSHFTPTLPPDDRVAPHGVESLRSLTQIVVPRLNINVADPPRTLGTDRNGHMSREAVTALINSSLRKDQPASLSLASRLTKRDERVSLDPMSYLHVTSNVARANANGGGVGAAGPLTYDQLLAKTAGGGYAPQSSSAVPTTLRPLLSLLASSATGAPAPDYDQAPMEGHGHTPAPQPPQQGGLHGGGSGFPAPSSSSYLGGDRGVGSASLGSIVNGRASMLSMNHLRGR